MTKDGVTTGTVSGTMDTTLRGSPETTYLFQYGLTAAYGSTIATGTTYSAPAALTVSIPIGLTPGATYHWRSSMTNDSGTYVGADKTFTFTMPTCSTVAATDINTNSPVLHGTINTMGVASSVYAYFQWGYTPAYGNTTAATTFSATGSHSAVIAPDLTQDVYFRMVTEVDGVYAYGAQMTFDPTIGAGFDLLNVALKLVVALGVIIGVILVSRSPVMMLVASTIGLVAFGVISALIDLI
jgi:hypothetical protein